MRNFKYLILSLPLAYACDSFPEITTGSSSSGSGDGDMGGAANPGDDNLNVNAGGAGGGNGNNGGGEPVVLGPCASVSCEEGEFCQITGDTASCEEDTCASLQCENVATQTCIEVADGPDFCKDIGCSSNLECDDEEYCDTAQGICIGSVCEPSASACDGQTYNVCNSNGSQLQEVFSCGSSNSTFVSQCVDGSAGEDTGCTCLDDWDCPEFSRCEATTRVDGAFELTSTSPRIGVCVGTGEAPTCSLPPSPFSADNTDVEIQWGSAELGVGNEGLRATTADDPDTPYPGHVQVVVTPTVANLDDDNGDGFIDEKDIPEIIFLSFATAGDYQEDGVLRAIHGGGERKGKDFFASCGSTERWTEEAFLASGTGVSGGVVAGDGTCTNGEANIDSTAGIAVGDLNYDGVPEIVVVDEANNEPVHIYSNTGQLIATSGATGVGGGNPYPTLANLDADGLVEIVVGDVVHELDLDMDDNIVFANTFSGGGFEGRNGQGPISCPVDVDGDGVMEIVAGPQVYSYERGVGLTSLRVADDLGGSPITDDGLCAVADVLGADKAAAPHPVDNPLDGVPEIVLISDGELYVFDPATGTSYRQLSISGDRGGPPNVDDFDGDGLPEVGTATEFGYEVFDFQTSTGAGGNCPDWSTQLDPGTVGTNPMPSNTNPDRLHDGGACTSHADCGGAGSEFGCNFATGTCVCLHNGWRSTTQDGSSKVTGSSVFDFNGDGAAEVVYNDECMFRVYDGRSGEPYIQQLSESRTRIEYPIVADTDRDGNAEIVFASTTESNFCVSQSGGANSSTLRANFNAGVEVWGDLNDLWVSARGVWNQHAYHVTNVTESGQIPVVEPSNWLSYNGRTYNTYRSNPRNYGVAPDLVVGEIQYLSPDASCGVLGTTLDVNALIRNDGDLLVGTESVISFEGTWGGTTEPLLNADGSPVTVQLGTSLDPRRSVYVTILGYDPTHALGNNRGSLPDSLTVRADATDLETECNDEDFGSDNNALTVDVVASGARPDLEISGLSAVCSGSSGRVSLDVENNGTADATGIEVAFYNGDPDAGGVEVHREEVADLEVGESVTLSNVTVPVATGRDVAIFAVVDPGGATPECNDNNNSDSADPIRCGSIVIPR